MGLTPIIAPLLEIRATSVRLPPPEGIAAILLASGNAVEPLPAAYRSLPVLTVGDATARRARDVGFSHVASAEGDAIAMVVLVRARFEPKDGTLLLAAGRGQSLALAARLRAAGYRVARRVVYAAVPVAALPKPATAVLVEKKPCAVLFFSAETARCFMRLARAAGLLDALTHCEAITIGNQAAMALEGAGWSRIRAAGRPNQDEMLALLR